MHSLRSILALTLGTGALGLAQARAAIDPERAALVFGETEEAALADDGKLWGLSLVGPILLADPRTRQVAANQPDEEGRLREQQGVFAGVLPESVTIANTGTDWAGVRWTMVMWPLPEERSARTQLLLHESFHRIQPRLAHGGTGALAQHLGTEPGRTWLRLEFRALAEALAQLGERRREALGDALLFRARRRALFAEALASESALERNEGLAEYTGLRLCGLTESARAERAAARLRREEVAPSLVRSFAYATGPAYGLALDELDAGWRAKIAPGVDLAALLAQALGWRAPAELERSADERAAQHGGAEVAADERRRAEQRTRLEAELRARFVDGPVLTLAFGTSMNYSFDPNDVTPLADVGSVYGGARVVDDWGVLDAGASRALFLLAPGGALRAAQVPAPRNPTARPLTGEGWSLSLAPGWSLAADARAGDWKVVRSP